MQDLPENIDSRFRYVMIVARRAEQLIQGAAPKARTRHTKATRVAMDEVNNDLVKWQLTPPASPLSDEPAE